jgi:O-Antigen ligase
MVLPKYLHGGNKISYCMIGPYFRMSPMQPHTQSVREPLEFGLMHHKGALSTEAYPVARKSQIVRRDANGVQQPTTRLECFLLMVTPVVLPLEQFIPIVDGFSIMWIWFAALTSYVLCQRLRSLNKTWLHPVFLAAYVMLALDFLIELSHPYTSYRDLTRIAQMIFGAVVVASLCRDRQALQATFYGYILAGFWLSTVLLTTSYGSLSGVSADDFQDASQIRGQVLSENPLGANANMLAAQVSVGTAAALALGLTARTTRHRCLFLGTTFVLAIGTFMPMSRGAILTLIVSCGVVFLSVRIRRGQKILLFIVVAAVIAVSVPAAIWSRMTFSTRTQGDKTDPRTLVYAAAIEYLPEYVLTGVGSGNYWNAWAWNKPGFRYRSSVLGAHNIFFQVTIWWGLAGILGLLVVIWHAYRCLPKRSGKDPLSLCLLGTSVSLLLLMLFRHDLSSKEFALGFGLLVAASSWIWPQRRLI